MALVGWDFPCLVNKFQTKIYGCSPTPKVKIGGFSQLLVLAGKKKLRLELTVHTNFKQNHWIFCTKPNQTKPNLHWWVFIAFYRDSIEQPSIGIAAICWFLKLGRVSFRKAKRRKQAWVKNSNIIQLNLDNLVCPCLRDRFHNFWKPPLTNHRDPGWLFTSNPNCQNPVETVKLCCPGFHVENFEANLKFQNWPLRVRLAPDQSSKPKSLKSKVSETETFWAKDIAAPRFTFKVSDGNWQLLHSGFFNWNG